MNSRICFSKKVGYLVFALSIGGLIAVLYGKISLTNPLSLYPKAKEPTNKATKYKIRNTSVPLSQPCGGPEQPICITTEKEIFCDYFPLSGYAKPVNKTFNQECRSDNEASIIEYAVNAYPEETKLMSWSELVDTFVDVYGTHKGLEFQPYDKPFTKNIRLNDGEVKSITVTGIDPTEICRDHPFFIYEVPEACPRGPTCGAEGEPCCVTQFGLRCENDTQLICDDHAAYKYNKYQVPIRKLNESYINKIAVGSVCVSNRKKP